MLAVPWVNQRWSGGGGLDGMRSRVQHMVIVAGQLNVNVWIASPCCTCDHLHSVAGAVTAAARVLTGLLVTGAEPAMTW